MSDFVGEQSLVHIMPISAKWKHKNSIQIGFIVFNGDVIIFFSKSVYPLQWVNVVNVLGSCVCKVKSKASCKVKIR